VTEPIGAPQANEAVWFDQHRKFSWNDEGATTYLETVAYYSTRTGKATRFTVENTTSLHPGRIVVRDKNDSVVFDLHVTAPFPLTEYDVSGTNVNVRANDLSDRFSVSVGVMG
jgi:hypothetical protein